MTGQGRAVYVDGSEYEGGFLEGQWHGPGAIRHPNGDVYTGQFDNGCKVGAGHLQRAQAAASPAADAAHSAESKEG